MKSSETIAVSPAPEEPYQEPADHDSWYSALVSFVFHFCLVMLLPLFAAILESKERLPPAVDMVQVLDTSGADADPAAGLRVHPLFALRGGNIRSLRPAFSRGASIASRCRWRRGPAGGLPT